MTTISELPRTTNPTLDHLVPASDAGQTVALSLTQIRTLFSKGLDNLNWPSVAIMLADGIRSYAAGPNQVTAGDLWATVQGQVYEVAAAAAANHDVATAAGVKLYVKARLDGSYNLEDWNADLTGVATAHVAFQGAINKGSAILRIPRGSVIKLGANITWRAGLTLDAPDVRLVADAGVRQIQVRGTVPGGASNLHENVLKGLLYARATTKGVFAAGDWVVITNTNEVDNDSTPKGRARQLLRVIAVDGTNAAYDQLTFDRALGFDFTAGAADKATITKVVPITDVGFVLGFLQDVQVVPYLVRGFRFQCKDANNSGALQADATTPSASRDGVIQANVTGTRAAGVGPNALMDLRGWQGLDLDIYTYGGREDGTRLYHCLDVSGLVKADNHGSRGASLYKCSGRDLTLIAEGGIATGNVEQIIADYCEDLQFCPRATGFDSNNGVELRGKTRNVTVLDPYVVSHVVANCQALLNLHPASAAQPFENVRVLRGYLKGSGSYGLLSTDGCDGLLIDGLQSYRHPGSLMVGITVDAGADMQAPRNVVVQNCRSDAHIAVNGSATLRAKNVVSRNNRSVVSSGSAIQMHAFVDDLLIEGHIFDSVPAGMKINVPNCTRVRVRGTKRPEVRTLWDFTNSDVVEFDDWQSEDLPAAEVAQSRPHFFDSFTDPDGTALTAHNPEVGTAWSETTASTTSILGNRMRITSNGVTAFQNMLARAFRASLGFFRPASGDAVDYSFVFDRVDATNYSDVRFGPNGGVIEIRDVIAGIIAVRASVAWTIANGITQLFEINVAGRHVSVRSGGSELVQGVLGRFANSAGTGWRRNTADTGEAILTSLVIRPT